MKRKCTKIECQSGQIVKYGLYYRKSDRRYIQIFKCKDCWHRFSAATGKPEYRQHKRSLNPVIFHLLSSCVSRNRIAKNLKISPTTVDRRLVFLSTLSQKENRALLLKQLQSAQKKAGLPKQVHVKQPKLKHKSALKSSTLTTTTQQVSFANVQFDELETFEHSKCKPLSVAMAVDKDSRMILGFDVSQMPCKGRLAEKSRQKYGTRRDRRHIGLRSMFEQITPLLPQGVNMLSDMNPMYDSLVNRMLGKVAKMSFSYSQVPGGRGCSTGQGELKKQQYDPLFSLNHTFAMMRYSVNRLVRRTWCTTKKASNLRHHLQIYAYYHNLYVAKNPESDHHESGAV